MLRRLAASSPSDRSPRASEKRRAPPDEHGNASSLSTVDDASAGHDRREPAEAAAALASPRRDRRPIERRRAFRRPGSPPRATPAPRHGRRGRPLSSGRALSRPTPERAARRREGRPDGSSRAGRADGRRRIRRRLRRRARRARGNRLDGCRSRTPAGTARRRRSARPGPARMPSPRWPATAQPTSVSPRARTDGWTACSCGGLPRGRESPPERPHTCTVQGGQTLSTLGRSTSARPTSVSIHEALKVHQEGAPRPLVHGLRTAGLSRARRRPGRSAPSSTEVRRAAGSSARCDRCGRRAREARLR